jgi:hypothetical protein
MTWFAVGAAVVGAGASIYSANKSAGAIGDSANQATGTQLEMYYKSREDMAPWREAGENALNALMGGTKYSVPKPVKDDFYSWQNIPGANQSPGRMSRDDYDNQNNPNYIAPMQQQRVFDQAGWDIANKNYLASGVETEGMIQKGPGEFKPEEDPGYKFGYQEFVENPTLKMASATGKLRSGATQKALTRYASDYASTKYDNFLSRYYDSLKPYQSMAGVGQTTASQNAQNAMVTGQNVAQGQMAAGNARASGYVNTANAIGNAASGIGQNYLDKYYMDRYSGG